MKKRKNRVICFILAVMMIFGLMTPAFAAGEPESQRGIGVMVNGRMLDFADARPVNQNGKVLVPLRDVFEALGATVTFNSTDDTIKATLGQKALYFKVGSRQVNFIDSGNTQTKTLEIAPFIDQASQKTYIPARFAAESLGFCVGWDSGQETVVILDIDKLTQNMDADFSILNTIMRADAASSKTPMKLTGDMTYKIGIKATEQTPAMEMDMTAALSAIELMTDMEMTMNLSIDFDKMLGDLPPAQKAAMEAVLAQYRSIPLTIKMDGKTGDMYMKSDIFNLSPIPLPDGRTIDGSVWLKMNLNALSKTPKSGINLDYHMFLQNYDPSATTMESLFNMSKKSGESLTVGSYQDIQAEIAFIKALFGDSAFVRKTGFTYDTYVLNIGKESLKKAVSAAYPLASEEAKQKYADVFAAITESTQFDDMLAVDASYTIENNQIRACDVKAHIDLTGVPEQKSPMQFDMQMSQKTKNDQTVAIDMIVDNQMTFHITMDLNRSETAQKPDLTVPSGEPVIDYMEMLSLLSAPKR